MHYYQFNIGDYTTHTLHLDDLEDLAYRRMLDWYYLHESPLPDSVDQIAKFIRMRTHTESIANVLHEFFTLTEYGYQQKKVDEQIKAYQIKSEKAKASAAARWSKKPIKSDANALPPQSDSNANHKPLTNNHKPITNNQSNKEKAIRFVPPTIEDCCNYFASKNSTNFEAQRFFNHYEANGWKVGKNKMKKWPAAASGWISRQSNFSSNEPKKTQGTLDDLDNYAENLLL